MKLDKLIRKLKINDINKSSWGWKYNNLKSLIKIKKAEKPVVIWGASEGGRITKRILDKYGIKIEYFVDSDKSKWGKYLCGYPIKPPDSLDSSKFVFIGSIFQREIAEILREKSIEFEWFAFYLMPNKEDIIQNTEKIYETYKLLEDEDSRTTYSSLIAIALNRDTGRVKQSTYKQYFHPYVKPEKNDIIVDGGAFNGNTVLEIVASKIQFSQLYAFEPDNKNYRELLKNTSSIHNVYPIKAGLWSKSTKVYFAKDGNSSSKITDSEQAGNTIIDTVSLDEFFIDKKAPTLIKMDIEGAEEEALIGARKLIMQCKPKLQICLYHKPEHLWNIPTMLKDWAPMYKFYLGHHTTSWVETVLYARS